MEIILTKDENQADARLEVKISLNDIENELNKSLREFRQKLTLPGFRPGMVPMSIAKKYIYEQAVIDEIEKKLESATEQYFRDNQLDVLRPALPVPPEIPHDYKNDTEFSFIFDIGLINPGEIDLPSLLKDLEKYEVTIDDADIDKEIERIRYAYSEYKQFDTFTEDEELIVYLNLKELDQEGKLLENGITKTKILKYNEIPENLKKFLIDKSTKSDYPVNIREILSSTEEIQSFFELEKEAAEDISDTFNLRILNLSKSILPEMNEELYQKITGKENETEEGFKSAIKEIIQNRMNHAAEHLVEDEIISRLKSIPLELPEKYIQKLFEYEQHEKIKDLSPESEEYQELKQRFTEEIKWTALLDHFIQKFELKADEKEVVYETYMAFNEYLRQTGNTFQSEKAMSDSIVEYLKKRKNYAMMEQRVLTGKLIETLKKQIEFKTISLKTGEFEKIYNQKHKEHGH